MARMDPPLDQTRPQLTGSQPIALSTAGVASYNLPAMHSPDALVIRDATVFDGTGRSPFVSR